MSVAYAAETVAAHGAFYEAPEFLVMIAFFLTIGLLGKSIVQKISAALDDRSEGIRSEIEEATRLREEAQDLLASYERKQRDAIEEAQLISERAKAESDYLTKNAEENLKNLLDRRQRQANERIAQAEVVAIESVRAAAIDITLEASRRLLGEKVKGEKADALIDASIRELPGKLH